MRGQLWRTVRTLGVAFLLMSGLGALFEEKGLSRGMLANPDMQPQLETKTKFADVKGVDEAKACSVLEQSSVLLRQWSREIVQDEAVVRSLLDRSSALFRRQSRGIM